MSEGLTLSEMATALQERAARLQSAVDEDGIELATIHGAKGREWDTVVLYGADHDQLPHERALRDATTDEQFQEAVEDERRLAYVAITRTKRKLVVVSTGGPSPFLREAGIIPGAPPLPTLASLRAELEAAAKATSGPEATSHPVGKPGPRQSMKARYGSTCLACKKAIHPGDLITRGDEAWVHESCGT
jgi:hypothetical protein